MTHGIGVVPAPVPRRAARDRRAALRVRVFVTVTVAAAALATLGGCASRETPPAAPAVRDVPPPAATPAPVPTTTLSLPAAAAAPAPAAAGGGGTVVGRGERLLVVVPQPGDTLAGIARRWLGSADRAWQIAEVNGDLEQPVPGRPLVVPLQMPHPLGVTPEGVQAVPILCYHRVGAGASKMNVTPERFAAQMQWLADNRWQVVRLSELAEFMAGQRALPQRAVVLTFDDGYDSVYRQAFPLLQRHGYPATLFVYTDFIGARDALSWAQMDEMLRSGLIDVQAHSKSHRNLTERGAEENDARYRARLDAELRVPRTLIERALAPHGHRVRHLAYPYGDANEPVLDAVGRAGYDTAVTVVAGSNPFYASPLLLKRLMIYGDHDLEDFKARLTGVRRPAAGRP